MDRSRRASHASLGGADEDRARKRRRQSSDHPSARQQVQEVFDAVWNYQERNRNIRQDFEELPSKEALPDYYEKIDSPISLAEIQAKLDEYESIDAIKKDLFLMLENATTYNKTKSRVYNDALRLRSIVDRFIDEDSTARSKRNSDAVSTPSKASSRGSKTSATTMKDVQLAIIEEMWNLKDENREMVAYHFRSLPPKKDYPDYYEIIERPMCLSTIRTEAKKGIYQTWPDFEAAVHLITTNAEQYNDENSEIVRDARALEKFFLERLHQERVKLGDLHSGIKLRINPGSTSTPTSAPRIKLNVPKPTNTPINGTTRRTRTKTPSGTSPGRSLSPSNAPITRSSAASPMKTQSPIKAPPLQAPELSRSVSATSHTSATTQIPNGQSARSQTPQNLGAHPHHHQSATSPSAAAMLPPAQRLSATPRPASYSPSPTPAGGAHLQHPQPRSVYQYDEPRFRPENQDRSTYLLTSLHLSTHPPTSITPQNHRLPPSRTTVTAQYTLTLPSTHSTITLTPTLSPYLTSRPYRLSVEWKYAGSVKQVAPVQGRGSKGKPEYEVRLVPGGLNTVEVMAVTHAKREGAGVVGWEMERFRVWVNVLP
ncbi:Bromodomain-containing protein [Ascodesmis nigricans]|uniref:Bromodomain-containing protein n=1 Tax=Ascodesmis nigricans TaxID=341454 RepID=A0A4S2MZ19_9PEZI|nr:Bromodomain-containing protein [Ascodesmis nigricans]